MNISMGATIMGAPGEDPPAKSGGEWKKTRRPWRGCRAILRGHVARCVCTVPTSLSQVVNSHFAGSFRYTGSPWKTVSCEKESSFEPLGPPCIAASPNGTISLFWSGELSNGRRSGVVRDLSPALLFVYTKRPPLVFGETRCGGTICWHCGEARARGFQECSRC